MTIQCCDPNRLPKTGGEGAVLAPNRINLPNAQWTSVHVTHPALVIPITEGSTFYFRPKDKRAIANAEYYPGRGGYGFLHAPGTWEIYNASGASRDCVILDAYNGIGALIFGGLRIIGTGGAADVRDADADADFAAALLGMVVNARNSILNIGSSDWARWTGDTGSAAAGRALASIVAPWTLSIVAGADAAGAGPARIAQVSNMDAAADVAQANFGLLNNSRMAVREVSGTGDYARVLGLDETNASGTAAAAQLQMRSAGYFACLRDRLFVMCLAQGQTGVFNAAFAATAPMFLFVAPATNEWIVKRLIVSAQGAWPTNTRLRIVTDPDNRYDAATAPTSFIPTGGFKSKNRGGSGTLTPTRAVYDDGVTAITATAADNDELEYGDFGDFGSSNAKLVLDEESGLIVPPSGSLLVYGWSTLGTELASIFLEVESANVQ